MLKIKYLYENFDDAKRALNLYAHDEDTLEEALSWFRISSNAIYPYFNNKELCFLRMAPKEEKDLANLQGELEFLNYLKAHNYPAMEIVKSLDGKELNEMDNYYLVSFKCVPGEAIDDTDMNNDIIYSYGQSLGQLHNLSKNCPKIRGKWNEENVFSWMEEVFSKERVPQKMLNRFAKLRNEYQQIDKTKENYGLIHYDFEIDNVFYDEASKKCYVIDFDDSMYNFYYLDYLRALDNLDDDSQRDIFSKGYYSIIGEDRVLDKNNELILETLDDFWSLYTYARILNSLSDQGEENPEWKQELVAKLTNEVKRIEEE